LRRQLRGRKGGGERRGKGGEGRGGEREGNVEGPGMWSAPGPALALGGPGCTCRRMLLRFRYSIGEKK